MLTYVMIGALAVLLLLCVAGDFTCYSGKRYL